LQLDLARRHPWVLRPREARRDLAGGAHDELVAHPTRDLVCCRGVRLVDDDLGDAVPIAQVEEDQLAMVAPPVDPARQTRIGARIRRPELAARVGPIGRGETRGDVGHGRRIVREPSS
jgi:hypothetical protein